MHLHLKATAYCGVLAIAMLAQYQAQGQQKDSTRKTIPLVKRDLPANGLKPYAEVITAKAVTYSSFLKIHEVDNKYFLEIPTALLGREILTVNRIAQSAAEVRTPDNPFGYAGDLIGENMFCFRKGDGNKIYIASKSYKERAADTSGNGLARSLARNNAVALIQQFPLRATNDSAHTLVIEITDYLNQDNQLFGFDPRIKTASGLGAMAADRSYVESVSAFEDNINIRFIRTYSKPVSKGSATMAPFTFQLSSSMILLPETPMNARLADKRAGFQEVTYIDFDKNPLGVIDEGNIYRWRLVPENSESYAAGKLTAPLHPITIYLDPALPAKWVPYIKSGIEAWNVAFEKAGFKNAIRVLPVGSTHYLDDAHTSAVVFKPGNGDAQEHIIVDPRSGEILQVQLNFYLSTLNTLYKQYFIQAGALDKAANKPAFDDALMGRLVEAWCTQKTGRLLGLKTNAGASSANRIADIRNNAWLKANAFNGSATDEALINYAVQPEDHVDAANLLAKVGETDGWLLHWGYQLLPAPEDAVLNKWIVERSAAGKLLFPEESPKTGNINIIDPRNQLGDVGNDAVTASALGIANLKKIVPNILNWTRKPLTGYDQAAEIYGDLVDQYRMYVRHVTNQLGGVYTAVKYSSEPGSLFNFVPLATQKSALNFLLKEVFETPSWLADKSLYSKTTAGFDSVTKVQKEALNDIMDVRTLSKLLTVRDNAPASAYAPQVLLKDLSAGIFAELNTNTPISITRRELQKFYVNKLLAQLQATDKLDNDLPVVLKLHAKQLMAKLKQSSLVYTGISKSHLTDLYERMYIGLYLPVQSKK